MHNKRIVLKRYKKYFKNTLNTATQKVIKGNTTYESVDQNAYSIIL